MPRSCIDATRVSPVDAFGPFAARSRSDPGWRHFETDASHSPHVTAPDALLEKIVGDRAQ